MSAHPHELDIRTFAPAQRQPQLLLAFGRLLPGEFLHLVSDHDPTPLLYELQVARPGEYNWSPLESGPRLWRVRIDRRPVSHRHNRTVNEYLSWDHDRLDACLERVEADARAGNWRDAAHGFGEFRTGLLRHIRLEEELLFPAYEQHSGSPRDQGPTAVMREEHGEIRGLLEEIGKCVEHAAVHPAADALELFTRQRCALLDILGEHNLKEEQVLYPAMDHFLDDDARDALVRRLMAVR